MPFHLFVVASALSTVFSTDLGVDAPVKMTAARVVEPPVLDGEVLEDPIWRAAAPATGFWQVMPFAGAPSSERTDVRIVYTRETLYVGVVCHDRAPEEIVVSGSRRDSSLDSGDAFEMVLDTFHDGHNGLVFGTNPAGQEYDGQVVNEGQGTGSFNFGQMSGSGAGFNLNWDATWEVKTKVGPFGWSAEIAIPFRSLRYTGSGAQTWGINFQRNIRRHKEVAFWSPLPRQLGLMRVSAAGTLEGLDVPAQQNLKLVPYVLRETRRDPALGGGWDWRSAGGVDLKYSVTPSLTLDATLGTDFSQVEVDEHQINLDRFTLFFPEKRPFFLENAGLFAVGDPGDVEMFFSRRIGIGPGGEVIPIAGGGRLSGKVGSLRLGLLDMQAEAVDGVTPANNFSVGRVGWELPNRSAVGVLIANRQVTGSRPAGGTATVVDDHNRTFAVDGQWGVGRYGLLSAFAAKTSSITDPDPAHDNDMAFQAAGRYDSPDWLVDGSLTGVGGDFNPEVGFLRRTRYTKPEIMILHRFRPENFLGLFELRPHIWFYDFLKADSVHDLFSRDVYQETRFVHIDNHFEWRNGYEIHTGVNLRREGVLVPFEIHPGVLVPAGIYDFEEVQILGNTNFGAPVSADLEFRAGGFFGGRRLAVAPHVRARLGETFIAELLWSHNRIHLPAADFTTNLVRGRISYSFTTRLFTQALLQYNDVEALWSTNLRLGWLQSAGAGLFVVYNENLDTTDPEGRGLRGLAVRNRSLVCKLSLVVDVL